MPFHAFAVSSGPRMQQRDCRRGFGPTAARPLGADRSPTRGTLWRPGSLTGRLKGQGIDMEFCQQVPAENRER